MWREANLESELTILCFAKDEPPSGQRLIHPPLLNFECSILLILHVVNFGHLDGFVPRVYDCRALGKFSELIEGAHPNAE